MTPAFCRTAFINARLLAGVLFLSVALGGCALLLPQTEALRQTWPAGLAQQAELTGVPFFPQRDYECGPAALAMVLTHAGTQVDVDELVKEVYIPARRGSLQAEMLAAPRRHDVISYRLAPRFEDLLREVAAGTPVIVLQDYGVWPFSLWHYAVVVGYDARAGEAVLRSGEKPRLTMPLGVLEYTWKESGYWAMVAVPPARTPATASEADYLTAVVAFERVADARASAAAFSAFLERWPDNVTASIGLANALYAQRKLKEAEAVLSKAAARHPDAVVVLNNLAQVLADQRRYPEAMSVIEQAMSLGEGPFSAAVRETRDMIRKNASGNAN
jgi:tetratricopeptide (TPR) repeat protein